MTTSAPTTEGARPRPGGLAWETAAFAGFLLATVGIMMALEGVAALAGDDLFTGRPRYFAELDLKTWGWVHVTVGALTTLVGGALLMGARWARMAGLLLAVVGAVVSFLFVPYFPFWALAAVAFHVLVLWSLCRLIADE
ncbi:hypothetical protein [Aeromicrobium sp. IC_218]|uniref:DUF7144 family membrane protein n=1 Tax=Aeromicrobium sp. IC_218 TaxID=2545468 RepID=UPI0013F48201|nr:hypothetical protein [Aeromicrobium sp. IC_218]